MKGLIKLLLVVVVIAALAVGALFYFRDDVAAALISKAGEKALGVPTEVDDVDSKLRDGRYTIRGLGIDNPIGFGADRIFSLGAASVTLPFANLGKDPLVIERVAISELALSLERKAGDFNYESLLEHASKLTGGKSGAPAEPEPEAEAGPGKTIIIKSIDIDDWSLALDLGSSIDIPTTSLEGWTITDLKVSGEDAGAELAKRLFQELLDQALSNGLGNLPADILNQLGPELDELKASLEGELGDLQAQAQEQLDSVLQEGQEQIDSVLKEGQEQVDSVLGEGQKQLDSLLEDGKSKLDELLPGDGDGAIGDLLEGSGDELEGVKDAIGEQLEGLDGVTEGAEDLLKDAEEGLGGLLKGFGKKPEAPPTPEKP